jgi:hypothetical protein
MFKRKVMRTLLTMLVLLGCASVMGAEQIPPDKEIIYFDKSKMGIVTFMHKMHSTLESVNCTTCHHTSRGKGQPEDCHNCHQPEPQEDVPESVVAFHTRCRGCHQYTVDSGKKAGPVKKCTLCHIPPPKMKQ